MKIWGGLLMAAGLLGGVAAADYRLVPATAVEQDMILAEVNGVPVTLSDVMFESWREETQMYAVFSGGELEAAIAALRRQTLEDLIDRQLVIEDFKQKELVLENQYVEQILDQLAREMGCADRIELKRRVREFNTTMEILRTKAEERLMAELMFARLFYEKINLTPKELHEYITAHAAAYVEPARIRFRLLKLAESRSDLTTRVAEIVAAASQAETAANFPAMVTLWSDGPAAASGGDLGWLERKRVRREFAAAWGETPQIGVIYGPVTIPGEGVFFLQVTELTAEQQPDRNALQTRLREQLEAEARNRAIQTYLQQLRQGAMISYLR